MGLIKDPITNRILPRNFPLVENKVISSMVNKYFKCIKMNTVWSEEMEIILVEDFEEFLNDENLNII